MSNVIGHCSVPHRQPHRRHRELVSNHCSLVVDGNGTVLNLTLEIVKHAVGPYPSPPSHDRTMHVHVHRVPAAAAAMDGLRHAAIPEERDIEALRGDLARLVDEPRLPPLRASTRRLP